MSKQNKKSEAIKGLQSLRNIGPAMAERLYSLGIKTPEQMKKSNPEELFKRLKASGKKVDPCELYVFRGAVLDIPWWRCKDLTEKQLKENKPDQTKPSQAKPFDKLRAGN